jgi:hypothetical protein
MDTSKNTIVVGVLIAGEQMPVVDRIFNDEVSVRRLVARFGDAGLLRACYEAGPGGYELHRLLTSLGVACDVVAPSLIPKGASTGGGSPARGRSWDTPGWSPRSKRTVETYLDGFRKNDHAQILSCLTDDIEWTVFGAFHLGGIGQRGVRPVG